MEHIPLQRYQVSFIHPGNHVEGKLTPEQRSVCLWSRLRKPFCVCFVGWQDVIQVVVIKTVPTRELIELKSPLVQ
jgi:hypothetical protein